MESTIQFNSNLKKSLVFHLNKIGSLIIYILLPDQLKSNPKQMKFLHKCDNNKLEIKIKDLTNKILINYNYYFNDNSFSIQNIKRTVPKIISLSPNGQNNSNNIKYLMINYSITKSTINDYYFIGKILNYDTSYDYLEKIIEKKINKSYKKLKVENLYCSNCNNNLFVEKKELINDYDSIRIEQNLEEFFNCQNNYNSFMQNKDATQGIQNLKQTYEIKYNLDTMFLWIFDKYIENNNNSNNSINIKNKREFIFCEKCKEVIGRKEEYNNILFNKLYLNLINMDLIIDDNENNIIKVNNFFTVEYLNVLLTDCIRKGNKNVKFVYLKNNLEININTKINILGLISKKCEINEFNGNILIDNYINLFEINCSHYVKYEMDDDCFYSIILNERNFTLLENIIKENMEFYFSELFFYKLLTDENKKFYCFSIPKKEDNIILSSLKDNLFTKK